MDKGDSVHRESVFGSEKRNLILLLGIALALRIILYRWTYLIAIDGTGFYLKPAHYFASGQWMDGLAIGYHRCQGNGRSDRDNCHYHLAHDHSPSAGGKAGTKRGGALD